MINRSLPRTRASAGFVAPRALAGPRCLERTHAALAIAFQGGLTLDERRSISGGNQRSFDIAVLAQLCSAAWARRKCSFIY
jgi:hypothetical protein